MTEQQVIKEEYFKAGQDWYVDRYESVRVQANRWFVGFIASIGLCVVLTIAMISLFPLKTLVPLVIHKNTTTGEVWLDRPQTDFVPANDAEVQSDIVRFITLHESYTAADINQRFNLVMLLSANQVGKQYADIQGNSNKTAPINVLGQDGKRIVHVEDIIFIDKSDMHEVREFNQPSHNLAKVDFTTTTILPHTNNKKTESWVATIGWTYKGLPTNQSEAWDNWNGFTVTTLRIDPKHIG
tara:strand:- start:351 stop:1070 length:720 start_codon:yes stop_codon:yes gene_type:complete